MLRILITSYNSSQYIHKCIQTIKAQVETDFKAYITDDISTDGSQSYIPVLIQNDSRFELICNKEKMYQPGNYWQVLQKNEIKDDDICVEIDSDDWLPDSFVFTRVLKYYSNPNIWITCGQFEQYYSEGMVLPGFVKKPEPFSNLRKLNWTSSHLRTFKAFLFRKIKIEDLLFKDGRFLPSAGDLAFMCPMLEMAGEERSLYIEDQINYIYNVETPYNDHKVNFQLQEECANYIRNKPKYERI